MIISTDFFVQCVARDQIYHINADCWSSTPNCYVNEMVKSALLVIYRAFSDWSPTRDDRPVEAQCAFLVLACLEASSADGLHISPLICSLQSDSVTYKDASYY